MNVYGIVHEAKSKYAYQAEEGVLHLRIKTAVGDVSGVDLVWGDPFFWTRREGWQAEPESPKAMTLEHSDAYYDYWFIAIEPTYRRVRYAFVLKSEEGRWVFGANGLTDTAVHKDAHRNLRYFFNFPYLNEEDRYKAPAWVKDTVWYQIFPERFANGDSTLNLKGTLPWNSQPEVTNEMRFGGDLEGVVAHLDDIQALGVTGIYFTPIFEAPTTHKYDTIDYFKIDPAFGDNATFKRLVEEAHKRGMRVMLDAVFNHCGFKHPYFQDVVEKGFDAYYAQCFHLLREPVVNFPLDKDGFPDCRAMDTNGALNYETFAFTPNMPKWRTDNPVAAEYLLDVATYWIEHYDIDGWRLDVSNEVSHAFWRRFKERVQKVKPDVFIMGENLDNAEPWLKGDQFHSIMNYSFTYAVWRLLGGDETALDFTVADYKAAVSALLVDYPIPVAENLFTFLDCHDTSRIMTLLGKSTEKVEIAYLLQMTFPGCPCIYYGSEIGLEGVHDGNRVCMPWEPERQAHPLKAHVQELIRLRKARPAMRATRFEWLATDDTGRVLAFEKSAEGDRMAVVINTGDSEVTYAYGDDVYKLLPYEWRIL